MYTGMFRSMVGNFLCSYGCHYSQVSIRTICTFPPSYGLLAFANCSRVLAWQSQESKGAEARLSQMSVLDCTLRWP